jgi:putative tricarboxylic transport membrane protein
MNDGNLASQSIAASPWRPTREVEFIVGTPPGGGQDRPARVLMRVLESAGLVDQPMKLSNITGKGGGKAWEVLRLRAGDAHVLSISSGPLIANRLQGVTDYDHADFTAVVNLYSEYLAFVVPAASPMKTAADLLARLNAGAGDFAVAIATALGSSNHIALARITHSVGADPRALKLRVFDSALKAVADVVEGNAEAAVVSAVSAVPALQAAQVRVLAVSAPQRMAGLFAVTPTWVECGIDCTLGQWRGFIGAPGLTAPQVAFWEQAFAQATARPEWQAELAANYWTSTFMTGADTRAFLDKERDFLGRTMRELGLIT